MLCQLLLPRALQGGVVLGADTRSTAGTVVADKNCEKIHYIAPNIYCCGAGTAADTENVTGACLQLGCLGHLCGRHTWAPATGTMTGESAHHIALGICNQGGAGHTEGCDRWGSHMGLQPVTGLLLFDLRLRMAALSG